MVVNDYAESVLRSRRKVEDAHPNERAGLSCRHVDDASAPRGRGAGPVLKVGAGTRTVCAHEAGQCRARRAYEQGRGGVRGRYRRARNCPATRSPALLARGAGLRNSPRRAERRQETNHQRCATPMKHPPICSADHAVP